MNTMNKLIVFTIVIIMGLAITACGLKTKKAKISEQKTKVASETLARPSDADFLSFMVFHHMNYMMSTANAAGGTNRLLHTRKLPTEGTDAVVTPALDHIYTKSVIDLTDGIVAVTFPDVENGRYYSIHITDEEHYTIYDEVFPKGI